MNSFFRKNIIKGTREDRLTLLEMIDTEIEHTVPVAVERELFILSVSEALDNAVEHGNGNDESLPVHVKWHVSQNLNLFHVQDNGSGFHPRLTSITNATGPRGRGLGLISENCDAFFHNANGNAVTLIKGVPSVKNSTSQWTATVSTLPNNIILISNLNFADQKLSIAPALTDIFDQHRLAQQNHFLLDLKQIRLISSMGWGSIFAEAEREDVSTILLFNAPEAILRTAMQMGLQDRSAPYNKITLFKDADSALQFIAETARR